MAIAFLHAYIVFQLILQHIRIFSPLVCRFNCRARNNKRSKLRYHSKQTYILATNRNGMKLTWAFFQVVRNKLFEIFLNSFTSKSFNRHSKHKFHRWHEWSNRLWKERDREREREIIKVPLPELVVYPSVFVSRSVNSPRI